MALRYEKQGAGSREQSAGSIIALLICINQENENQKKYQEPFSTTFEFRYHHY